MIIWTDIETTGLDPGKDDILEVAFIVTDDELTTLVSDSWTIVPYFTSINDWSDSVRKMHSTSGLINDVVINGIAPGEFLDQAHRFFEDVSKIPVKTGDLAVPLGGSSVHFDRAFLTAKFPTLQCNWSYRNIDVSTVRSLVQSWRPDIEPWKKNDTHRAMEDLEDSINELAYYQDVVFEGTRFAGFEHRASNH